LLENDVTKKRSNSKLTPFDVTNLEVGAHLLAHLKLLYRRATGKKPNPVQLELREKKLLRNLETSTLILEHTKSLPPSRLRPLFS
jgi:EAL domain-containing protein (putative c-di-GMP-specific phosphodiesterase class I)